MDIFQIIVLAIIQGLTEFLPISSSAHLILIPKLTTWPDQGLAFDVAVHIGSLVAVLWYFRNDLKPLTIAWVKSIQTRQQTPESRLVWAVGFATIPVAIAGLLMAKMVETDLRSITVIAIATIVFGLLLGYADVYGKGTRNEYNLTWKDVLFIGLAQALALIPGTSRSGITMTAALLLNLERKAAARFSFLLAIPAILLAGGHDVVKLLKQTAPVDWFSLGLGTVLSAVSAYFCIKIFIDLIDRIGMLPFVVYRLLLGMILLAWVLN